MADRRLSQDLLSKGTRIVENEAEVQKATFEDRSDDKMNNGIVAKPRATAAATMVLSLMVSRSGSRGPCRKDRGGTSKMETT